MKLRILVEATEAIQKLLDLRLPSKTSFKIQRSLRPILSELETFENERKALIQRFAQPDDDGRLQIPPDKMDEFLKEMNDLLDVEIDLSVSKISIEELGDTEMSVRDLLLLEFLFEES